ncbi:signal peptidase I [Virgibacillus sp. NKC19-16]|uniref:signal peptidase I n=1 Tax=Virgibacillus salidurans TaxID=2831673 RepID=UPI001F3222A4|nr:signal peptidase I [Virgibacillus sp. NKC19-16]UJL46324.1 signal peptidase I [Virgibacillus sp. NKC19-16]
MSVQEIETREPEKKKSAVGGWIGFVFILLLVFLIFRYALGIIVISGNSMSPTIEDRDIIISSNIFYSPNRNDIVLYRDENGFDVVKRIIALPNQTVEINDGTVIVDDDPIDESFVAGTPNDMEETVVHEGTYFVLGDNRTPGESLDSRSPDIGSIAEERIKGEFLISVFPFHF